IEVIDSNHAVRQAHGFAQQTALRIGEDALADSIPDPVNPMETAHLAGANGPLDLLLRLLRRDDFLEGNLQQPRWFALIAGYIYVSRQPIPDRAWRYHEPHSLLAEPVRSRLEVPLQWEHEHTHQHAHPNCGEVVDRAGQRLIEPMQAIA